MEPCEQHFFHGVHVLGEMYGIKAELLNDANLLEAALRNGINASGATLCSTQVKEFEPFGVTVLALLSESHASIHTYPDRGALFFDAFTCGSVCQPIKIAEALIEALAPTHHNLQSILRGESVPGELDVALTSTSEESVPAEAMS